MKLMYPVVQKKYFKIKFKESFHHVSLHGTELSLLIDHTLINADTVVYNHKWQYCACLQLITYSNAMLARSDGSVSQIRRQC